MSAAEILKAVGFAGGAFGIAILWIWISTILHDLEAEPLLLAVLVVSIFGILGQLAYSSLNHYPSFHPAIWLIISGGGALTFLFGCTFAASGD